MPMQTTKGEFAKAILGMTYGGLMEVAAELSEMKEKDVRPKIETPEEYASLLHDWADAQGDED